MKFCGMCGHAMENEWAVCPACGTKAEDFEQAPAETVTPPVAPPAGPPMAPLTDAYYEGAMKPMVDPAPPVPPAKKKGGAGKVIVVIAIVLAVLLLLLGVGGFLLWKFVLADGSEGTSNTTVVEEVEKTEETPSDESAVFLGRWRIEVDYTDFIQSNMESEFGFAAEIGSAKLPMLMSFYENGRCEVTYEVDDLRAMYRSLVARLLEAEIQANGYNVTVDQYLAVNGYTMDSYIDELLQASNIPLSGTGQLGEMVWKAQDGKLFLENKGEDFNDDDYMPYSVDKTAGTIVLLTPTDTAEYELGTVGFLFPMTLHPVEGVGELTADGTAQVA